MDEEEIFIAGGELTAKTHFRTKRITANIITRAANTSQYAIGDVISDVQGDDHLTFKGMARGEYWSGSIDAAFCFSSTVESVLPDLELWLFQQDIAKVADNGAFAVTDLEMSGLIGIIDFPVLEWRQGLAGASGTGNSVCYVPGLQIPFVTNDSLVLFGQFVLRNTYTPINSEIFKTYLMVSQD